MCMSWTVTFNGETEQCEDEDDAMNTALDWSVEEHGAQVIVNLNGWPYKVVYA
jgi:hypothetical protein